MSTRASLGWTVLVATGLVSTVGYPATAVAAPGSASGDRTVTSASRPAAASPRAAVRAPVCSLDTDPPAYYAIPLITTRNVPGTARASGTGSVSFGGSPFGVAVAPDGSYAYRLSIQLRGMRAPSSGTLVAWVTTPDLTEVVRLGPLADDLSLEGSVAWNKYLVVISLEADDAADQERWEGPIVLRGMSRSGMMHTMAGHGPFQQENCQAYGYGPG